MDPGTIALLVSQLLPVVLSALAPVFTWLAELLGKKAGTPLPDPAKPVVNAGAGAAIATLTGGNPISGVVGAMVGNRIREAINWKRKRS